MPRKVKIYNVDFQQLERHNYNSLSQLGKEIVDKMVELSLGKKVTIPQRKQAKIDLIMAAFEELTVKQKNVLIMVFGLDGREPRSEREIAEQLKISQQTVHDLKDRAIKSIRKKSNINEDALKNITNDKKSS
jgi:RNA polymerase sigma factor (sigma-70 family)